MKKTVISIILFLSVLPALAGITGSRGFVQSDVIADRNRYASAEVTVSPNPVHDHWFTIELSSGYLKEISILNITGTVVYHRTPDTTLARYKVYTGKLPDGVYLLKITTQELLSRTYKLMICNSGK